MPDSASLEGTVNWTTRLGEGDSLSLNGTYERSDSRRLQGLDTVLLTDDAGNSLLRSFNALDPLAVDRRSQTWSAGGAINLGLGDWQVTGTVDGTHGKSRSRIQRRFDSTDLVAAGAAGQLDIDGELGPFPDAGIDESRSTTDTLDTLLTARSNPVMLPAGELSVTLDTGFRYNRIQSTDTRNPGIETDLDRSRISGGANVSIPLTSKREDFLGAAGDFTLNLSGGVDELSDFGTLTDWSAGLTWGITDTLTANATYTDRDAAPSLTQLGDARIVTPNVPVFDLVNNQTVLASVVSGGNPFLPAENQSDWKVGLQWELPFIERGSLSVDYIRNRSSDISASFPVLTPAIEAAFPDRVTRDGTGRLVQLDERPVTFASQRQERLQFGLNLSGQLGSDEPDDSSGDARGGRGDRARPGGGDASGSGGGQGRGGFRGDPEQFAAMRTMFCNADPDALRQQFDATLAAARAGEAPPVGPDGQPLAIPPRMLERLAGEDGTIDPERFAAMRERICSAESGGQGGDRASRGGSGGRGMSFGRGRGGGSGGRWFANLQYSYELENEVLIAPGVPLLDLLDGDAIGSSGQARHSGSVRAGAFYKGFGLIASANYTGSSRLDGTGLPGSTDLKFGDFATVDLRTFVDLEQQESLLRAVPFFKGARVSLSVDNIFDARQRVTDSTGAVPLRYQPFLVDPVGRSFEIEFRKLF